MIVGPPQACAEPGCAEIRTPANLIETSHGRVCPEHEAARLAKEDKAQRYLPPGPEGPRSWILDALARDPIDVDPKSRRVAR